MFGCEIAWE